MTAAWPSPGPFCCSCQTGRSVTWTGQCTPCVRRTQREQCHTGLRGRARTALSSELWPCRLCSQRSLAARTTAPTCGAQHRPFMLGDTARRGAQPTGAAPGAHEAAGDGRRGIYRLHFLAIDWHGMERLAAGLHHTRLQRVVRGAVLLVRAIHANVCTPQCGCATAAHRHALCGRALRGELAAAVHGCRCGSRRARVCGGEGGHRRQARQAASKQQPQSVRRRSLAGCAGVGRGWGIAPDGRAGCSWSSRMSMMSLAPGVFSLHLPIAARTATLSNLAQVGQRAHSWGDVRRTGRSPAGTARRVCTSSDRGVRSGATHGG